MTAHTGGEQPALSEYKAELTMGVAIIALVVAALMVWVGWSVKAKERELHDQVQERLELLANSRVEVLRSWLSGLAQQTDQLIASDLFRLYATDLDMIEADPLPDHGRHPGGNRARPGLGPTGRATAAHAADFRRFHRLFRVFCPVGSCTAAGRPSSAPDAHQKRSPPSRRP